MGTYTCEHGCGYHTSHKVYLAQHLRQHTGTPVSTTRVATQSSISAVNSLSLAREERHHTPAKTNTSLDGHARLVHKSKKTRFNCKHCGFSTRKKTRFDKHAGKHAIKVTTTANGTEMKSSPTRVDIDSMANRVNHANSHTKVKSVRRVDAAHAVESLSTTGHTNEAASAGHTAEAAGSLSRTKYSLTASGHVGTESRTVGPPSTTTPDPIVTIDNYTFHESGTGGAAHGGMQTGDKNTNTGSGLQDAPRVRQKVRKCKQCGFKATDKAALTEHMLVHAVAPPVRAFLLVCAHCEFQCSTDIVLKEHLATHVNLKCEHCDFCADSKGALTKHQRTHMAEKLLVCELCDYSTKFKSTLTKHLRVHTGEKPYGCEQCDFRATHMSALTAHARTHTGEKPFKCSHCIYRSAQKSDMVKHQRLVHEGLRPFKCEHCDYHARQSDHLTRHLRMHTGERPYPCGQCDYRASRTWLPRYPCENSSVSSNIAQHCAYPATSCVYAARNYYSKSL